VPCTERPRPHARPRPRPPEARRLPLPRHPRLPRRPARTVAGASPRIAARTSRAVVARIARGHALAAVAAASWARAGAIEQALSAVHDHTSSAAHGGRAGGQRTRAERTPPGPPVPMTTPSIRLACRPTSRYVRFRGHAAQCFKPRVCPARSADRTVERHPRQRTRCLACWLHSTLPARRCADCRPELAKIDDRAAGPEPHTAGAHGVAWASSPGVGPRDGTDLASCAAPVARIARLGVFGKLRLVVAGENYGPAVWGTALGSRQAG
jgi:hypothetical protein